MFSEPVAGEKFFGREETLELLNKRVLAMKEGYRQNVALSGQGLAGKSSIILHFLHSIRDEGFIPIYVEVAREPFRLFAGKFIATMLYNVLEKAGHPASINMEDLLDSARGVIPKTHTEIKRVLSSIDHGDAEEAYSELLGLTLTLKNETGMPCLVILDEFDNLEHIGVKNPFLAFGKVIMVQKDTMYIVSSSRDSAVRKIISEKLSLLFGNFEIVKISNFDMNTARSFIRTKLAGFDMEEILETFFAAFTDGNPFYLDKLVSMARTLAAERMTSFVDKEIAVEAILDLTYNAGGAIHQYLTTFLLETLDYKNRAGHLAVLVGLARGNNKQAEIARALKIKQSEALKTLGNLTEIGLVSKSGIFYKIDDTILEFWLGHVYDRRKALLVDGTFDKMGLFRDEIRKHIDLFEDEFNKDPMTRIAELFDLFSNELVGMEGRNMRLPHFSRIELKRPGETKPFIAASVRGNFWLVRVCEEPVTENDIIDFIRSAKAFEHKISNKILITLKGMDDNARLLAKELRMSIWGAGVVNMLLGLYGKSRIFRL